MSYVPGFEYDLFISYSPEDNVDAWVERFHEELSGELKRLLGHLFSRDSVFFDKLRLKVGQAFPSELDKSARGSAVLVALLSPNYVTSNWCNRERQQFQQCMPRGASFMGCLAAVLLRPTGPLPQVLRDAQHKSFVQPGSQQPWVVGSTEWREAVHQLAVSIREMLHKLRGLAGPVFVGSTLSGDMNLRARIGGYLSQQRFRATPDSVALLDDPLETQGALSEAICSVHFVGGAGEAALQAVEDSVEICKGPTVVFQPFGMALSAQEELLLKGLPPERYPHLLSANEIELKTFLEELLSRAGKTAEGRAASLSLVCEPADFPWAEEFQADDISVDYPRFLLEKLTNTDKIRRWRQMVRESHGLLFFQGRTEEALLDTIHRLADQEQSTAERCWYVGEPDLEAKKQRRPAARTYPMGLTEFLEKVRRFARPQ